MPVNLLKEVQQNLGLSELIKIDPVTSEIEIKKFTVDEITQRLDQACLTAVFTGIYNLAHSDRGLDILMNGNRNENWPSFIFHDSAYEIIQKIVDYAHCNQAAVVATLDLISAESIGLIFNKSGDSHRRNNMKLLIANQRLHILPYLPPALHVGSMLNDNTLDDVTNKMEGPVSSFMHKMELAFSAKQTEEEAELHRKMGNL